MITDADIKKMKTVFLTKEEAKRFATKEDLKRFATKDDLKKTIEDLTDIITGGFDRLYQLIKENSDIFNDHERRLDRVEDKVFA